MPHASPSVRRGVSYNILIKFEIPMKSIWLIKITLKQTYSEVRIRKHLFGSFLIQNVLNKEMLYYHCFSTLV
jgi:hypothetical protein